MPRQPPLFEQHHLSRVRQDEVDILLDDNNGHTPFSPIAERLKDRRDKCLGKAEGRLVFFPGPVSIELWIGLLASLGDADDTDGEPSSSIADGLAEVVGLDLIVAAPSSVELPERSHDVNRREQETGTQKPDFPA